jgi:hypothetical protein
MKFLKLLLLSTTLLGASACGGPEDYDDTTLENDSAAACADPPCTLPPPPTPKPDLVPEIASGVACPINNGQLVGVRVHNIGNASAVAHVVRVGVKNYTGVQQYETVRYYRMGAVSAGQTRSLGVDLGDGANAVPGNGTFLPSGPMTFFNGPNSFGPAVEWTVSVDTAFGPAWFGSTLLSYAKSVNESDEVNNTIRGTSTSCVF